MEILQWHQALFQPLESTSGLLSPSACMAYRQRRQTCYKKKILVKKGLWSPHGFTLFWIVLYALKTFLSGKILASSSEEAGSWNPFVVVFEIPWGSLGLWCLSGKICSWLQLALETLARKAPSIKAICKCCDVSVPGNQEGFLELMPNFTL